MIKFYVEPYEKTAFIPNKYPEIIQYEFNFKIIIDNKLYFEEEKFPLFEFLKVANDWKKRGTGSFEYVSIETDDNPLISFISQDKLNNLFLINSPWQLFECKTAFTRTQLNKAIEDLNETFYN